MLIVAASTALALGALPAGSALAATTVGQTGPPLTNIGESAATEFVQTSAAMPAAGKVTGLQTQAASSADSICGINWTGPYDLQVLRPLGGNQYKVVGHTGNQTDPCDGQLHSYPPVGGPVAVRAGDVLGAYAVGLWFGVLNSTSGTVSTSPITPEPGVGGIVTVTPDTPGFTIDESATLMTHGQGQNNNNQ
jgi:hypothetical protein